MPEFAKNDPVLGYVQTTADQYPESWDPAQQVPVAAPPPVDLIAYAKQARWEKENAGISLNGVMIATDDRSKTMILGARLRAQDNPDFTTPWDADDGQVYELNAQQIIDISEAVGEHVAACFAAYSACKVKIEAGIITTTEEIDLEFS